MSDLMDQLPIYDFSLTLPRTSLSVRIVTQQNEVYLYIHYGDTHNIMVLFLLFSL